MQMSAADFLLSPEVQKLLRVLYAYPDRQVSVGDLAKATKLDATVADSTLAHLTKSGIVAKSKSKPDDQAETFCVNASFVFHDELRSIALKSFAAAEPIRAMLRSKFPESVLRAFVLGERATEGTVELLIVHGDVAPDETALKAALQKLVKGIYRELQVQVMSNGEFFDLGPRDEISRKLASKCTLEIITFGDTRARLPVERTGLFSKAKKRLAALAS
jgi:hypothetical protein